MDEEIVLQVWFAKENHCDHEETIIERTLARLRALRAEAAKGMKEEAQ